MRLPPDQRARDAALGAVMTIATLVAVATTTHRRGPLWLNLVAYTLFCAPIAVRRRRPLAITVWVFAAAVANSALLTHVPDVLTSLFVIVVTLYTLGHETGGRTTVAGMAVAVAGIVGVDVASGKGGAGDIVFPIAVALISLLIGRALRSRTLLARELALRNERLAAEQEARAEAAAAEERRRIARELHDVIAHSVSVMVVQAGGSRRVLDRDPQRAAEALATVEDTGRLALAELRRLLGLIREPGADAALAPQPTLARLDELVGRARAAGLPVELAVQGDPYELAPGVDLAAYRVVQEALTNTLKHAGPARASVLVRWSADGLELEISDTGHGPAQEADHGHGLVGMRERVALYGGELRTSRRRGGGFVVRARIPRETVAA